MSLSNNPNALKDANPSNPRGNGSQNNALGSAARNHSSSNLGSFGRQIINASPALGNRGGTPIIDFDDWSEDPFTDVKESDVFAPFEGEEQGHGDDIPAANGTVAANISAPPVFPASVLLVPSAPPAAPMQSHLRNEATRKRSAADLAPAPALSNSAPAASPSSTRSTFSRRKKKPKGMPKRPLSAYNLYFQAERGRIIDEQAKQGEEGPKIGFEGLGKIIGKQWKNLCGADRKKYELMAEKDGERYRKEMDLYNDLKTKRLEEEDNRPLSSNPRFVTVPSLQGGLSLPVLQNTSSANAMIANADASAYAAALHGIHHPAHASPNPFAAKSPPGQAPALSSLYSREMASSGEGATVVPSCAGTPSHHLSPTQAPKSPVSMGLQHQQHSQQQQHLVPNMEGLPKHTGVPNSFPLPPGMEIVLSDSTGMDRKYKVHYTCYSMTREAAHQYLESLTGSQNSSSIHAANGAMYRGDSPSPPSMANASSRMPPPPQASAQGQQQSAPDMMGPLFHHYGAPWSR
jgi:hypothetical protein